MRTEVILEAARKRADALSRHDSALLRGLLHPQFSWTSHKGDQFDRETYLQSNIDGQNTWHSQMLEDPKITMCGSAAVLTCIVRDDVTTAAGRNLYRMPMTQVWTEEEGVWLLVAGHAGPLLPSTQLLN
ncbi:nuclear transport factor 2 family protein [Arthrobacter sp. EH-1B-1]|uniref:Nuclear transport factor 2 family protein n=1 Tax=Arthrobacter vasquezii TaxID=2977629 RepID=A0ABT6CXI6_9MICC|nr:nuclear transport factor 2 family protein [Arthrobacter vasquezii]MDF9277769.1 nuclear transport factor 2 family protein [Arthrobacter vasquezii]